ncbi:hypothetical protein D3C84_1043430 [compost metagenome]
MPTTAQQLQSDGHCQRRAAVQYINGFFCPVLELGRGFCQECHTNRGKIGFSEVPVYGGLHRLELRTRELVDAQCGE